MSAQNVCSSQNRKNLQVPASAHEEMEDAQVGDRELQTTTDRNKGTRTTATTTQVDSGRSRTARIQRGAEIATKVSSLASSAEQAYPTVSEPSPRTRARFDHPAPIVLNAHQ